MKIQGIYSITHTASGRVYVGSAANMKQRWYVHRTDLDRGRHHAMHLQNAWGKYGPAAFVFEVLEHVADKTDLIAREQFWIDDLKAAVRETGFNTCQTAGSALGVKRSDETRQRQSLALTGKRHSDETKALLRAINLGKTYSAESKMKRGIATKGRKRAPSAVSATAEFWTGRKHSDEAKAKMSTTKITAWAAKEGDERTGYWAGKTMPAETRAKMTASHTARWARVRAEKQHQPSPGRVAASPDPPRHGPA